MFLKPTLITMLASLDIVAKTPCSAKLSKGNMVITNASPDSSRRHGYRVRNHNIKSL